MAAGIMTLLEAARYLDEGRGAEAVELLSKAARTVMQHAGDMKTLAQQRLVKETVLDETNRRIETAEVLAVEENKRRAVALKLALEEDQQVLKKSKEEIEPSLQEVASIKEQVENAKEILRETISENDRIAIENTEDMAEAKSRLEQVEEAIKQAKANIGAL